MAVEIDDVEAVSKALNSCPTNLMELIADYNGLRLHREGKTGAVQQVQKVISNFEDILQTLLEVYLPVSMEFLNQMGSTMAKYEESFENFHVNTVSAHTKKGEAYGNLLLALITAVSADSDELKQEADAAAQGLSAELKAAAAQEKTSAGKTDDDTDSARKGEMAPSHGRETKVIAAFKAPMSGIRSLLHRGALSFKKESPVEMKAQDTKALQDLKAVREAKASITTVKQVLLGLMSRLHHNLSIVVQYYTRINAIMCKYAKLTANASATGGQLDPENSAALERHYVKMRSPARYLARLCNEFKGVTVAKREIITATTNHLQARPGRSSNIVAQEFLIKHSSILQLKSDMDGKTGWLVMRQCTGLDVAPPGSIFLEMKLDNTANPTNFLSYEFTAPEALTHFKAHVNKADTVSSPTLIENTYGTCGLHVVCVGGDPNFQLCKPRPHGSPTSTSVPRLLLLEAAPGQCVTFFVTVRSTGELAAYHV